MIRDWLKVALFVSSYIPLQIIIAIQSGFRPLWLHITTSIIMILSLAAIILLFVLARNMQEIVLQVHEVADKSEDVISYFLTYILGFLDLNLEKLHDCLTLLIIFLTLMLIYVKTNRIFINPILIILGFKIYEIKNVHGDLFILITRKYVPTSVNSISIVKLSHNVLAAL